MSEYPVTTAMEEAKESKSMAIDAYQFFSLILPSGTL